MIQDVPCPRCGAKAKEPCRTKSGRPFYGRTLGGYTDVHEARVVADREYWSVTLASADTFHGPLVWQRGGIFLLRTSWIDSGGEDYERDTSVRFESAEDLAAFGQACVDFAKKISAAAPPPESRPNPA